MAFFFDVACYEAHLNGTSFFPLVSATALTAPPLVAPAVPVFSP